MNRLSIAPTKVLIEKIAATIRSDSENGKEWPDENGFLLPMPDLKEYTAIEDAAAEILAPYRFLVLNRLTSISAATAQALASNPGELALNGLTSLSPEAAEALSQPSFYAHRL